MQPKQRRTVCRPRASAPICRMANVFPLALVCLALASASPNTRGETSSIEGYGSSSRGGTAGDVYRVTTLADGGPGSLRHGIVNRSGPRTIVFDVAGIITLTNNLTINRPYLTIEGATAPAPGITLTKDVDQRGFVIGGTHDIIVRHLRFQGLYPNGAPGGTSGTDFLVIDGDTNPDRIAQRIVIDHVTILNATDSGLDIWGEVSDVTVSWCLIAQSFHPSTVSHVGTPFQKRRRISMHHNVFARNGERNPQLRADVADFDYVNNIVYAWGHGLAHGYGIRVRNDRNEPKVNANFVNNYFLPGPVAPGWALVYGGVPGPDADDAGPAGTPAQGTVVTNTALGKLWVSGNIFPVENRDHYSTVPQRNPVPTNAQVTAYPALELKDRVVPGVGTRFRTAAEQALLAELAARMQGAAEVKILRATPETCVLEIKTPNTLRNDLQFADRLQPATWRTLTNVLGRPGALLVLTQFTLGTSGFYRVVTAWN
jgi:pectate lyase